MKTHLIVRGSVDADEVRRWLERPLARLRRQLVHFPSDAVHLRVLVREDEGAPRAEASLTLRLPSKTLAASEEEPDARTALREAFEELERLLKKEKARLRRAHEWRESADGFRREILEAIELSAEERSEVDPTTQARREGLTRRARRHHDALTEAINRLERALAAAAPNRMKAWSKLVAAEVDGVREAMRAHVEDVEEDNGLFDELESSMPHLSRRLGALRSEHASLEIQAAALAERISGADPPFASLRNEAAALLTALRAHRGAEADLVYEAFWIDLGAVD